MIENRYIVVAEFTPDEDYVLTSGQKYTLEKAKESLERAVRDSDYGSFKVISVKKKAPPPAKKISEAEIEKTLKQTWCPDGEKKDGSESYWFRCVDWELTLYDGHDRDSLGSRCYVRQDAYEGRETVTKAYFSVPIDNAPRSKRECAIFWLTFCHSPSNKKAAIEEACAAIGKPMKVWKEPAPDMSWTKCGVCGASLSSPGGDGGVYAKCRACGYMN